MMVMENYKKDASNGRKNIDLDDYLMVFHVLRETFEFY